MTNDDLQMFGAINAGVDLPFTLEPDDDPNNTEYEVAMQRASDKAQIQLKNFDQEVPF